MIKIEILGGICDGDVIAVPNRHSRHKVLKVRMVETYEPGIDGVLNFKYSGEINKAGSQIWVPA